MSKNIKQIDELSKQSLFDLQAKQVTADILKTERINAIQQDDGDEDNPPPK